MAISLPVADPTIQPNNVRPLMSSPDILGEIDAAHASLSPPAQDAIAQAHGMVGLQPPAAPAMPSPALKPPPLATMGATPSLGAARPVAPPTPSATAHTAELARLTAPPMSGPMAHTTADTGQSGIGQIKNPYARIPLNILDALGRGLVPGIEMGLPGTSGHHDVLVHQAGNAVKGDETARAAQDESALKAAQTTNQEAIPELNATKTELAHEKQSGVDEHNRATEELGRTTEQGKRDTAAEHDKATLATHGFKKDEKGNIVPLPYKESSPEQQAVHDLKASQAEAAAATADLKKAQAENQPTLKDLAMKRLQHAEESTRVAAKRLGLSEDQFEFKTKGTVGGVPQAGGLVTDTGQTVGTANAANVRPTTTQRDAAGRADTMLDLDARIRKALQNPEIQKGTGPLAGRLSEAEGRLGTLPEDLSELRNDLISYGAFQAGLHPVRGIGALQYFDKVMGGLGQNPEELLGKLDSNKATAGSVKKVGDVKSTGSNAASNALPGNITLDDIDAEIARRKSKK